MASSSMIVSETDLQTYQICPRRYQFSKTTPAQISLKQLQRDLSVWTWTHEMVVGSKVSLSSLKRKWASMVGSVYTKDTALFDLTIGELGNTIATGFISVRKLWDYYNTSNLKPIGTMYPTRYTVEHVGTVSLHCHVVCEDHTGIPIVLNYSDDQQNHDTVTNLTTLCKLVCLSDITGCTKLTSIRITNPPEFMSIQLSSIDRDKLKKNIKTILLSMKRGVDYPIFNCRLQCPYKEICF